MGNRKRYSFTDEEIDFLTEMMNIGSGNGGTAFSQLLQCKVDIRIPKLHVISATEEASSIFRDESGRFSCVKMSMVGDRQHSCRCISDRHQLLLQTEHLPYCPCLQGHHFPCAP
jgi:chemotaxis protein CheY-P-specific phosphatase CheC